MGEYVGFDFRSYMPLHQPGGKLRVLRRFHKRRVRRLAERRVVGAIVEIER